MTPFHIEVLKADLQARIAKNPRFSLRSYAKKLGIHPSALSRLLSGKLELSIRSASLIAKKLDLSTDERRRFLRSLNETRRQKEDEKLAALMSEMDLHRKRVVIVERPEFADSLLLHSILELTHASDFKNDVDWIAERVGRSPDIVGPLIKQMIDHQLLQVSGSTLSKVAPHTVNFFGEQTCENRKAVQREILEAARVSLEHDPIERRGHFGLAFAVNPERIPEIKQKMIQFLDEILDPLEMDQRTEVYQLAVQLFPLTKPKA